MERTGCIPASSASTIESMKATDAQSPSAKLCCPSTAERGRYPERALAPRDLARSTTQCAAEQSLETAMADPLYLNLWFPSFEPQEMLPRALMVIRLFPFSAQ